MPRPKSTAPAYQFHISGQARVILDGKDFYLGPHGTPESYARYYALLADGWGIHTSFRGGWGWYIWGRTCVVLWLRKGILRVGTDDADQLSAFLNRRLSVQ